MNGVSIDSITVPVLHIRWTQSILSTFLMVAYGAVNVDCVGQSARKLDRVIDCV